MIEISLLISGIAMLCAVINLWRSNTKDSKAEVDLENSKMENVKESWIKANIKLDQLCTTTNDIRSDVKTITSKQQDQDKEIFLIKNDLSRYSEDVKELTIKLNELTKNVNDIRGGLDGKKDQQ